MSNLDLASGRLLVRNTLLNIVGQGVPLIAGVVSIPYIVRGLGTERFGLLSLAWVMLGYFTIFDFGLGRTTTKYVAEALGKGEEEKVPHIVWTAVAMQTVFGLIGLIVFAAINPLIVKHLLNIPEHLQAEAAKTFYMLALSVPVVFISLSFRGVLEAGQRFDLVNLVKLPLNTSIFVMPLIGVMIGLSLPGIVVLLLFCLLLSLFSYLFLSVKTFSSLKTDIGIHASMLRSLLSFGSWITVSNIIGPILIYVDRLVIGYRLTLKDMTYYTVPHETLTRLAVVSGSLVSTLFPAFSAIGTSRKEELGTIYARTLKYVLLILGPTTLILVFFAEKLMELWLGSEIASQSTSVAQILAIGVLINSLALIPFVLLQGLGRPDITAKFHILELPLYVGMLWYMVGTWGLVGAALAWTIRVSLDAFVLFGACSVLKLVPARVLIHNGILRGLTVFAVLIVGFLIIFLLSANVLTHIVSASLLMILFAICAGRFALDVGERTFLTSTLTQITAFVRGHQ